MIEMKPAAWIGQQVFPTIQEAQKSELEALFANALDQPIDNFPKWAAQASVENADEIVAILTCTPKSKAPRKPRSDIGKKRAPKASQPPAI